MSLLVHPDDPDGMLVPQLHGTASWLAGMRADVFCAILPSEPEIIMRGDLRDVTDADRAALVSALLESSEKEGWVDQDWDLKRYYSKLRYPGLANQLRPYIADVTKGPFCRRVAIHMAEEAAVSDLVDELVRASLDPGTPIHIRVTAAYAVIRIGDAGSRSKLRPLVDLASDVDPDAELKGCGLKASWPDLLSSEELFRALTRPPSSLFGSYRRFLNYDLIQSLPKLDLPLALDWARQQHTSVRPDDFERLIEAILRQAWDNLDDPAILLGVGKFVWKRAATFEAVFEGKMAELLLDIDKRHRALYGTLLAADSYADMWGLRFSGLVERNDARWLLDQYLQQPESEKDRWAELLSYALSDDDLSTLDAAWVAAETDERLNTILRPVFNPIALDSDQAKRDRKAYLRAKKREERRKSMDSPERPHCEEQLERLLGRVKSGDLSAWWQFNIQLVYEPPDL